MGARTSQASVFSELVALMNQVAIRPLVPRPIRWRRIVAAQADFASAISRKVGADSLPA